MSERLTVIPVNPPQGFGRIRPSAEAGVQKFRFSWIPVALPPEADQPEAEASATRNPGISKTSGCRFRRRTDPSETLWRIRKHDWSGDSDFFCDFNSCNSSKIPASRDPIYLTASQGREAQWCCDDWTSKMAPIGIHCVHARNAF